MLTVFVIISAVATTVVTALAVYVFVTTDRRSPQESLLAERLLERFIVTVEGGRTFDGLLKAVDDRTIVLVDCSAISKDDRPFPVDGEVVLRRDSIAYMQKP